MAGAGRLSRRASALIAVFAVAAVTLGTLAFLLREAPPVGADLAIARWVQSFADPELSGFFALVSWPGYFPQGAIVTVAIAALFRRDWLWVLGTLLATLLNFGIKLLVARPRPTEELVRVYAMLEDRSFPSGHVVFYTALLGFVLFLLYIRMSASRRRTIVTIALLIPIVLVGISRVYLGHHWPSDVLGGYALAAAVLVPYCALYARRR